jgi:putative oxidoreductase
MAKSSTELRYGNDINALVLRVVLGLSMFYGHGFGKMKVLFGDGEIQFADPLGMGVTLSLILAVFAEVVCSFLLVGGLLTRYAVIPLIITMAVAVFVVQSGQAFGKVELPLLYLAGFVALFFIGPGRFSLDRLIKK